MARSQLERDFALEAVRALRDRGHETYWVGDCVRDQLLGLTPESYDIATAAGPAEADRLLARTRDDDLRIRVETFRTATDSALRRDFTINGLYYDPLTDQYHDFVGGLEDLRARVLRTIGVPAERFEEDKLRLLRAVRLAGRFALSIDPATQSAILALAPRIETVGGERVAEEIREMLVDQRRARAMRLFLDLGLAARLMPELPPMRGLPQGPPRPDAPALPPPGQPGPASAGDAMTDLWEHVLCVLDLLGPQTTFPSALAALLHDVGKPRTVGRTPDRYTFHGHEHVGRRMAEDICVRLKMSDEERERVAWLVEKHQALCDAPRMRPGKLNALLQHPGIGELLALHRADARAFRRSEDHVDYCEAVLAGRPPDRP